MLPVDLDGAFWAEHLPTGARLPIREDLVLDYVRWGWSVSPRTVAPPAPVLPLRPPPGPIHRAEARSQLEGGEGPATDAGRTVGRLGPAPTAGPPPPPETVDEGSLEAATEAALKKAPDPTPPEWDGAYVKATHLANRGKQGRLMRCQQCKTPFTAISQGQVYCLECRAAVRG